MNKRPNCYTYEMAQVLKRIESGPPPTTRELADIAGFDVAEMSSKLGAFRRRNTLKRELRMRTGGGAGQPTEAVWSLPDA